MKTFIFRAKEALRGEDGGPNVETIIGISVALIVATALIAFGDGMGEWILGATDEVKALRTK